MNAAEKRPDTDEYWVVGENSTIGVSKDEGATWEFQPNVGGSAEAFQDIHFMGKDIIQIPGTLQVTISEDGGATWESQDLPPTFLAMETFDSLMILTAIGAIAIVDLDTSN